MTLHVGFAPGLHPGRVVLYNWTHGQMAEISDLSVKDAETLAEMLTWTIEILQRLSTSTQTAEACFHE